MTNTGNAAQRVSPMRCPDCNLFVSARRVYQELEYLDPDESNQRAWFDYVPCKNCGSDRCLGLSAPL